MYRREGPPSTSSSCRVTLFGSNIVPPSLPSTHLPSGILLQPSSGLVVGVLPRLGLPCAVGWLLRPLPHVPCPASCGVRCRSGRPFSGQSCGQLVRCSSH